MKHPARTFRLLCQVRDSHAAGVWWRLVLGLCYSREVCVAGAHVLRYVARVGFSRELQDLCAISVSLSPRHCDITARRAYVAGFARAAMLERINSRRCSNTFFLRETPWRRRRPAKLRRSLPHGLESRRFRFLRRRQRARQWSAFFATSKADGRREKR